MVGARGFEPPISWPPARRPSQTRPRSVFLEGPIRYNGNFHPACRFTTYWSGPISGWPNFALCGALLFWWRRGRIELPVREGLRTGIYVFSHFRISPSSDRWGPGTWFLGAPPPRYLSGEASRFSGVAALCLPAGGPSAGGVTLRWLGGEADRGASAEVRGEDFVLGMCVSARFFTRPSGQPRHAAYTSSFTSNPIAPNCQRAVPRGTSSARPSRPGRPQTASVAVGPGSERTMWPGPKSSFYGRAGGNCTRDLSAPNGAPFC